MRIRIAFVTAASSRASGGVHTAVSGLARHIAAEGRVVLKTFALDGPGTAADRPTWGESDIAVFPRRGLRTYGYAPGLKHAVEGFEPDIIHLHGLWMYPTRAAAAAARVLGVPLVISPHGMLTPWAMNNSAVRKKAMWLFQERQALSRAAAFFVTDPSEEADLVRLGFPQPALSFPLGVDVPGGPPERGRAGLRTILFLGRIHPKKGIDLLIDAWNNLYTSFPGWQVRIVGPDEGGYQADLQRKIDRLKLPHIRFGPSVHGPDRDAAYAGADLFILPTHSDNFALTVAEALASGVPVISTKGAPWKGLIAHRCGWWVDIDVAAIAAALRAGMALPDTERSAMGERGRTWMQRQFSWAAIAARTTDAYLAVAERRPVTPPPLATVLEQPGRS